MSALLAAHALDLRIGARLLCAGLELQVAPGECWAVLGVNGTGKTTLLHTLAGLRAPSAGAVRLEGIDLTGQSRRYIARRIGLLPQETPDPFPGTVLETALLGRYPFLSAWERESEADRARARAALAAVELQGFEQRNITTLSGGERRRLAFALLLAQSAPLWLLDEPANHLDLRHQGLLLQQVRAHCGAGGAALMTVHDPNLAARYATHVLLLHGEGHWEAGTTEALLTEERLGALYGRTLRRVTVEGQHLVLAL